MSGNTHAQGDEVASLQDGRQQLCGMRASTQDEGAVIEAVQQIVVMPSKRVTLDLAAAMTGLTRKAMERKIERGDWLQGREYHRAPDGRIFVDMPGYERWVTGEK